MFLPISGNAQHLLSGNLVINPGFEDYIQCPLNYGQIFFVSNWSDGQGGGGPLIILILVQPMLV